MPEWFRKQPPPVECEDFYIRAYARLSSERHYFGQEVGPIPWSKVDLYARRYGLNAAMTDFFVDLLLGLDVSYRGRLRDGDEKQRSRDERKARREAKRAEAAGVGTKRRRWQP